MAYACAGEHSHACHPKVQRVPGMVEMGDDEVQAVIWKMEQLAISWPHLGLLEVTFHLQERLDLAVDLTHTKNRVLSSPLCQQGTKYRVQSTVHIHSLTFLNDDNCLLYHCQH